MAEETKPRADRPQRTKRPGQQGPDPEASGGISSTAGEPDSGIASAEEPSGAVTPTRQEAQQGKEGTDTVPDTTGSRPSNGGTTIGDRQPPPKRSPLATDTPVANKGGGASKYVISVDDASGFAVKIEKLDEKTGNRSELSLEEYAAAYSFAAYSAPFYAAYAASLYDPYEDPAVKGYYQALADYVKAFTVKR